MIFWVNQGKTYYEEKEGGYLWAPLKNSKGDPVFHWENMDKLSPGAIILNYLKGNIVGYCIAKSNSYHSSQPSEFSDELGWSKEGRMVDAQYYRFEQPVPIRSIYDRISSLLPERYGPINQTYIEAEPIIKANQGYLYELEEALGNRLLELLNIDSSLNRARSTNDKKEEIIPPNRTERIGLVNSRIGQGKYRRAVMQRWNNKCAVSGSRIREVLIASHIVPWREASNKERLDVNNGILLSPVFDALFDRNLISFDDSGKIILSKSLSIDSYLKLGVTGNEIIRNLNNENKAYLKRHREKLSTL
jgi:putative restriction endonuclease